MGRDKARRQHDPAGTATGTPDVPWEPDDAMAEPDAVIWIDSVPRTAEGLAADAPAMCRVHWDGWGRDITRDQVFTMAQTLNQAAAQADLFTVLMNRPFELDGDMMRDFGQALVNAGTEQGIGTVIKVVPAGASKQRRGVVLVKAIGGPQGMITPTEARRMAVDWVDVAHGSIHDELIHEALADVGGLDMVRRNQVMDYAKMIRAVRNDPEEIRAVQLAALRKEMGLPE